jgi:hypothetical protein
MCVPAGVLIVRDILALSKSTIRAFAVKSPSDQHSMCSM